MTRIDFTEGDLEFHQTFLKEKTKVGFHAHSYGHQTLIPYGWVKVKMISPEGETKEFQLSSPGYKTDNKDFNPIGFMAWIPAWHRHEVEALEATETPVTVLCISTIQGGKETVGEDTC